MDRNIVYAGSIPLDTDLLSLNRNVMVAIGALLSATLGPASVTDGLVVTPTSPPSLAILVQPGSMTAFVPVDPAPYGTLGADAGDFIVKMGINHQPTQLTLTPPSTPGTSIAYLIQAAFQERDTNPVVLPYYNAGNPAQAFAGPSNFGVAQPTLRQQLVVLQAKPGAAAATGTQLAPDPDAGWAALAVVTIAAGQTQITATSITGTWAATPIPFKLPQLRPGFANLQSFTTSGNFVVPVGVTTAKVMVLGGGGAGGTHQNLPGGGGGAGGYAVAIVTGLVAGTVIPVTVGTGGIASPGPGNGGPGGTSSFGAYVSATGGGGGVGGAVVATSAGGVGGAGVGGTVNSGGAFGTDGIPVAQRGGDGGGPGGGRGTSGLITGIAAVGFGGGGGGGGASQSYIFGSGAPSGTGAPGGNGGAGLVTVEF